MLIETTVLVLGAALLHAAWNTLVKTAADPLVSVGALSLVTAGPGLLLVLVAPIPTLTALPYLAGSVVLHFGYYLFLVSAYRVGDLSHLPNFPRQCPAAGGPRGHRNCSGTTAITDAVWHRDYQHRHHVTGHIRR